VPNEFFIIVKVIQVPQRGARRGLLPSCAGPGRSTRAQASCVRLVTRSRTRLCLVPRRDWLGVRQGYCAVLKEVAVPATSLTILRKVSRPRHATGCVWHARESVCADALTPLRPQSMHPSPLICQSMECKAVEGRARRPGAGPAACAQRRASRLQALSVVVVVRRVFFSSSPPHLLSSSLTAALPLP